MWSWASSGVTRGFLALPVTVGQVAGTLPIGPFSPPRNSLIGQCPTIDVQVRGKKIRCLVDTGSQVTLFSESLCKELFNQQLQGAEAPWLTLRGANGLNIPYIGYVVSDFQVRGITVLEKGVVIVRDHCLGTHRALLGRNVISACWEELFKTQPTQTLQPTEGQQWEHIFADCRRIHAAKTQWDQEDTGRVACRYALSIPARAYGPDNWVTVEPHPECQT